MAYSENTDQEYIEDASSWGSHQFVTLNDVINNFMLIYVGEENLIKKIGRHKVIFFAKRGLQELSYDILKEVKAIELDINPNTLSAILPEGYVSWVRVSQVHEDGFFLPLSENHKVKFGDNYLQDHQYNILFDLDGNILKANQNSYDPTVVPSSSVDSELKNYYHYQYDDTRYTEGGFFWLDTTNANGNNWFVVDERAGVIRFSSEVGENTVVIEYISDGLDYEDESNILVHKHAEELLYSFIEYNILRSMDGVQEYIVRRKQLDYKAKYNNSAIRKMNLNPHDLAITLRGRQNWIK